MFLRDKLKIINHEQIVHLKITENVISSDMKIGLSDLQRYPLHPGLSILMKIAKLIISNLGVSKTVTCNYGTQFTEFNTF